MSRGHILYALISYNYDALLLPLSLRSLSTSPTCMTVA